MPIDVPAPDRIPMRQRERDTLKIMAPVLQGERTQAEAARLLGLSVRQVRRLQRKLERDGDTALVHALRGKPSNRRLKPQLRQQVLAAYRKGGLRPEELEDLRQEARLGFAMAAADYTDEPEGGREQARFRTFLYRLVWSRLNNWEWQRRREEGPYDRSADWAEVLNREALRTPGDTLGLPAGRPRAEDPVRSALWQELVGRIMEEVQRQDPRLRRLLELLWEGRSLREAAGELALSYGKAKRMFRKLKAVLRDVIG
jgi:transposase